jgi:hypothetical protein
MDDARMDDAQMDDARMDDAQMDDAPKGSQLTQIQVHGTSIVADAHIAHRQPTHTKVNCTQV